MCHHIASNGIMPIPLKLGNPENVCVCVRGGGGGGGGTFEVSWGSNQLRDTSHF